MTRHTHPTLMESAETFTMGEMFQAPELPALIALDANLFAAINLLEFQHPYLIRHESGRFMDRRNSDLHIADSICNLASALRISLAEYYEKFREREEDNEEDEQQEIEF